MKFTARDLAWLVALAIVSGGWWLEHRRHVATQRQLHGYQGWAEDLQGMLEAERNGAQSAATESSDEEDPFGK